MSNEVGLLPPQSKRQALEDLARHPAVGSWKTLACHVRPDLAEEPDDAQKWLDRALDPDRREVFHDRHMQRALRLGARVGCHVLWHWYAASVGYKPSDPSASKSRHIELLEEKTRLAERQLAVETELEKIAARETENKIDRRLQQ